MLVSSASNGNSDEHNDNPIVRFMKVDVHPGIPEYFL